MLYFCTLLLVVIGCVVGVEDSSGLCYPCNELHRKWESALCENDVSDCGDCYSGYRSYINALECSAKGEIIIDNQDIAAIPKGSSVIINCQWHNISSCTWERNGVKLKVEGRYKQKQSKTECGIRIENFKELDIGEWTCNVHGNSQSDAPVHKAQSWLYLQEPKLLHVKENEVALVPFGQQVVMTCYFVSEVDCVWIRRGIEIEIEKDSRYSFVDGRHHGQRTTDCSLRINEFQEIDMGQWQCQSSSDPSERAVKRPVIELQTSVKPAKQITKLPPQHIVKIGSPVTLHCGYNVRVNCVWEKNGRLVNIGGRYCYTVEENGRNTKYCSLEISSLQPEDLGEWKCGYKYQQMTNYKLTSSTSLLVAPEVDITKEYEPPNGRRKRSVTMDNLSFKCSAKNSYPKAVMYWQWNGKDYHFGSRTVEQNGMFTTSITIDVAMKTPNSLMCIIQHPAFPYPKILRPDPSELVDEVRHGRSAYMRPTIAVIIASLFLSFSILLWETCFLGGSPPTTVGS